MSREVLKVHRRFKYTYDKFHAVFPGIWFVTIGLMIAFAMTGLDKRLGVDVSKVGGGFALLLIAVWLGLNGLGLLWQLPLKSAARRVGFTWTRTLLFAVFTATGILFVSFSLSLLKAVIAKLLK